MVFCYASLVEATYGFVKIISIQTKKHHFVSERFLSASENAFNPIPPGLFEGGSAFGGGRGRGGKCPRPITLKLLMIMK